MLRLSNLPKKNNITIRCRSHYSNLAGMNNHMDMAAGQDFVNH